MSNNPHRNLSLKLSEPLTNFNSPVEQLTMQLDKPIDPTALVEYYAYLEGSDRVLNSSFELWDATLNELNFIMQKRIDSFVAKKRIICLVVLITLALVIDLLVCFYRSVTQTVFVLDEAAKKMAYGNLDHKIILDNRDELGQVVGAFNKIADALVGANQEISFLKDRLKAENMRMSPELDVTGKIQQMLLPKYRELKEVICLDIAGFMEAAEEVGGDYYDVLQHKGRVKIGIGDVTGHGLESGVLMIMVQTAVRTLLAYNEPDQVIFLTAINPVI